MSSGKRKIETTIERSDIADALAALSKGVEEGVISLAGKDVELDGFESFSVGFKQAGEGIRMRVKVKFPKASDD